MFSRRRPRFIVQGQRSGAPASTCTGRRGAVTGARWAIALLSVSVGADHLNLYSLPTVASRKPLPKDDPSLCR